MGPELSGKKAGRQAPSIERPPLGPLIGQAEHEGPARGWEDMSMYCV